MSKFPVTKATGMDPGSIPHVTKKDQQSFNEAMNAPNNPTKNHRPGADAVNVTDAYTDGDNSK